jgi:Rrf2 family nitric oxide-sensitive transcriptional repressor
MARASEAFLESLNTETLASILAGTQMALPVETSA